MMNFLSSIFSPTFITVLTNLLMATVLGAVIGLEREMSGKIAGLRTHSLVSLGSALFTAISIMLFARVPSVNGTYGYDYHLVANIIVGIGFIGAGAIMRKDGTHVEGITTAASLWVAAAIGMASGFGFYREATAAAIFAYAILAGMWLIEKRLRRSAHYRKVHPETAINIHPVDDNIIK